MKRTLTFTLTLVLVLSLCACGAEKTVEVPDLSAYYGSYMESLGEEAPAMMDVPEEMIGTYYPGLENYELKQSVLKMAAITAVPFEFALVECMNAEDGRFVNSGYVAYHGGLTLGEIMREDSAERYQAEHDLQTG